jgi:dethiobiotin synthetase/adenosylmethionine--8-amino-7-oxononanoate aminotransferase
VADTKLGGISSTIAACEALLSRGYDIAAIVGCQELSKNTSGNSDTHSSSSSRTSAPVQQRPGLDNLQYLGDYIRRTPSQPPAALFELPACPGSPPDSHSNFSNPDLRSWLQRALPTFKDLAEHLKGWHRKRLVRLEAMRRSASEVLWWPFTQHANMATSEVTLIDARDGENFATVMEANAEKSGLLGMQTLYDACASWWTQGVSADIQPLVRQSIAYGAGRYGHVIFPEAVHEPALRLSEKLLETVGQGWASRVFFSDDGCDPLAPAIVCR